MAIAPQLPTPANRVTRITLCTLGMTASSLHVWTLYNMVYPAMEALWLPSIPIQSIAAALGYALVALAAARSPRFIRPAALAVACIALSVLALPLWIGGLTHSSAPLVIAGSSIAGFACSWARLSAGVALCAQWSKRDLLFVVILGEGLGAALRCVVPVLSPVAGVLIACAMTLAMLAIPYRLSTSFLRRFTQDGLPAQLATTNPDSFLAPTNRIFVLLAFFELVHGVALSRMAPSVALATNLVTLVLLVAGSVGLVLRRDSSHADLLLYAAALLMLAGALLQPMSPATVVASNACSSAGAAFSWMLLWMALASIGMRNPTGALWAFGTGYVMQALALALGTEIGRAATSALGATSSVANVVYTVTMVAFVGYLLVGLRGFSFSKAFSDIVPVATLELPDTTDALIASRCSNVARMFELTEREHEVLTLLARGHGGPDIQNALTISQNTAKTHVRHIYRKLNVHSQQELIDLVSRTKP